MLGTDAHFTRAAACTVSSARFLSSLSRDYSENWKFCKTEIGKLFDTKIKIYIMIKPEELATLLIQ